jgi:LAO/AO transport system kinase
MIAAGKTRGHGGAKAAASRAPVADAATQATWVPPIHKCVATRGEGIDDLMASLDKHHTWIASTEAGRDRRRARLADEVRESLRETLIEAATDSLAKELDDAVAAVDARTIDPYTATERLLESFRRR